MAETTEKSGEKKLSVSSNKTLSLKGRGVEQGVVRQSFSHGRTKAVVVEKVKSRAAPKARPEIAAAAAAPAVKRPGAATAKAPAAAPAPPPPAAPVVKSSGMVLRTLTDEEQAARARALGDARLREEEERKIAAELARIQKERDEIERKERDDAAKRKAEEESRRKHDQETKTKAEQTAKARLGEGEVKPKLAGPAARGAMQQEMEEEEAPRPRRGGSAGGAARGPGAARPAPAPKPARPSAEKSRGRLTLVTALNTDEVRERSVASFRRRTQRLTGHRDTENKDKLVREVTIPEFITIQELANRMAEPARSVIALLSSTLGS